MRSDNHSGHGAASSSIQLSGVGNSQFHEVDEHDLSRMPIMTSNGSPMPRSTKTQWLTLFLAAMITGGIVILIGVTSATNKKVVDGFKSVNDKIAASDALGLPGYESLTWSDVLAAGKATQTVNLYVDSGSKKMWRWFMYTAAPEILAKYGITLNVVTTLSSPQIVQLIETENGNGKTTGSGSVDIFWVNGVNYYRAVTGSSLPGVTSGWGSTDSGYGNLLYGPWANLVPSAVNYDWTTSTIAYDMGTPNNGYEMPVWAANFNLIYRTDKISNPPKTFKELVQLVNTPTAQGGLQGKINFWDPAGSSASVTQAFLRHFLYENCQTTLSATTQVTYSNYGTATTCSPGTNYAQYVASYGTSSIATYKANVKNAFQQLQFLESGFGTGATPPTNTKSNLFGNAYCKDEATCQGYYQNGDIWLTMEYSAPYAGSNCADTGSSTTSWGNLTLTAKALSSPNLCANTVGYIPATTGAVANNNFMVIPKNAANKLGAVVVGNWIGSMDAQFSRRYGLNAYAQYQSQVVNRWIGNFNPNSPAYTGSDGGPSWQTAYDYLSSYHNYPQTPAMTYLRPPYALPEIDSRFQLQFQSDWVTCMGSIAQNAAYGTSAPCA